MPEVVLENITMRWGNVVAAEDVNLRIHDGEYVTILGPSGCGKTTLVRIIAGILKQTKGEVYIDGKSMANVPTEERDIGYVFQNIALFPHFDVLENVSYGPRVRNFDKAEWEKISHKYLELVKLLDKMEMFPSELCGGEQQKVSLARALSTGAKLLLLDEPLSALDARVRVDLRYDLRRLVKSLGLTTLHVTHDQEEAMSVSDRIVLMRNGRIVESDTPENMYMHPRSIFSANFIGETNLLEGVVKKADAVSTVVELRDGTLVDAVPTEFNDGDPVVVSVRPENVYPGAVGLHAVVYSVTFVGTYLRVMAEADSDDRVEFDVPTTLEREYNKGDDVNLTIDKRSTIVYARTPGGIGEATRLE